MKKIINDIDHFRNKPKRLYMTDKDINKINNNKDIWTHRIEKKKRDMTSKIQKEDTNSKKK